jgi:hypothetical protein
VHPSEKGRSDYRGDDHTRNKRKSKVS